MTQRKYDAAVDEKEPEPLKRPMLSPEAVVEYLEKHHSVTVKVATLRAWRTRGTGPDFFVIARQVRYSPADLIAWVKKSRNDGRAASA